MKYIGVYALCNSSQSIMNQSAAGSEVFTEYRVCNGTPCCIPNYLKWHTHLIPFQLVYN